MTIYAKPTFVDRKQITGWKCFHPPSSNKEQESKYQQVLYKLKERFDQDMDKLKKKGKLKLTSPEDKNSIGYVPDDIDKSMDFAQQIVCEMELRKKCTADKTINQMRNKSCECSEAEKEMVELIEQLSHTKTCTKAIE